MEQRIAVSIVVLLLGLELIEGCVPPHVSPPETVDVSGTVTLDGKPLVGVAVHFQRDTKHLGIGVTRADGSYRLGNQAAPGLNDVSFAVIENVDDATLAPIDPDIGDGPGETDEDKDSPIPAKYREGAKPALTFFVPTEGTTEANFELTSD